MYQCQRQVRDRPGAVARPCRKPANPYSMVDDYDFGYAKASGARHANTAYKEVLAYYCDDCINETSDAAAGFRQRLGTQYCRKLTPEEVICWEIHNS